jgi:hypothetical protein
MVAAVAFGLSTIAVNAIARDLRRRSHPLPGSLIVLFALGAALYAAGMGADGIGPIAVRAAGGEASLFFDGSGWWVSGIFMAATVTFGLGLLGLVRHAVTAGMVRGLWIPVAIISTFMFVALPAIPSGWGLFGVAVTTFGIFLPMAASIWRA